MIDLVAIACAKSRSLREEKHVVKPMHLCRRKMHLLPFVSASILQARRLLERKAGYEVFPTFRHIATAKREETRGQSCSSNSNCSTRCSSPLVVNRWLCGRGKAKVTPRSTPRVPLSSVPPLPPSLSLSLSKRMHCVRISAPQIINIRGTGNRHFPRPPI